MFIEIVALISAAVCLLVGAIAAIAATRRARASHGPQTLSEQQARESVRPTAAVDVIRDAERS